MAELFLAAVIILFTLTSATVTATTPSTNTQTNENVEKWHPDVRNEWVKNASVKCTDYPLNVLQNVYTNKEIYDMVSNVCVIHEPKNWTDIEKGEWANFVKTKCNAIGIESLSNDDIFTFSKECPTIDKIASSPVVKNYWTSVAKMNCPGAILNTDALLIDAVSQPPKCPTYTSGGTQLLNGLHLFTQDGTFEVKKTPVTAKVLVVGGGASGTGGARGHGIGYGGAAGGVTYTENVKFAPGVYTIKVGAGGDYGSFGTKLNSTESGSGKSSSIVGPGVNIVALGGPWGTGKSPDGYNGYIGETGLSGKGAAGARSNGSGTFGGNGFVSDITGVFIEYGTGGGGGGASGVVGGWPNGGGTWSDGKPGMTPGSGGGGGGQNGTGSQQPGAKGVVVIKI